MRCTSISIERAVASLYGFDMPNPAGRSSRGARVTGPSSSLMPQRVTICRARALARAQNHAARGSKNQFFQGVQKILLLHAVFTATSSQQGRLVDEVFEVGTHESRRRGRDELQVDVRGKWHPVGMDLQDSGAAC